MPAFGPSIFCEPIADMRRHAGAGRACGDGRLLRQVSMGGEHGCCNAADACCAVPGAAWTEHQHTRPVHPAAVLSPHVLTGLGPVSQLSVSTGLPRIAAQLLLAAFVVHGLYGFSPSTPTWSSQNRNDLLRRPRGVPRTIINPFTEPGRFFGYRCGRVLSAHRVQQRRWCAGVAWTGMCAPYICPACLWCVTSHLRVFPCVLACSEWGFTKANEVFAGRWVMSI